MTEELQKLLGCALYYITIISVFFCLFCNASVINISLA